MKTLIIYFVFLLAIILLLIITGTTTKIKLDNLEEKKTLDCYEKKIILTLNTSINTKEEANEIFKINMINGNINILNENFTANSIIINSYNNIENYELEGYSLTSHGELIRKAYCIK